MADATVSRRDESVNKLRYPGRRVAVSVLPRRRNPTVATRRVGLNTGPMCNGWNGLGPKPVTYLSMTLHQIRYFFVHNGIATDPDGVSTRLETGNLFHSTCNGVGVS